MNDAGFLREAAIYLAAAAIAVPLFTRIGLGAVLGYLTAGMLIGPSGLGLIAESADVLRFAEFGIVLLLFVIGLELKPSRLWTMRRDIFGLGTAQVVFSGLAITAVLLAMTDFTWQAALVVGLPLALSSTALVVPYLQEHGNLNSRFGERTFSILLMQDLAIVPLLIVVSALARRPDPGAPEGLALVGSTLAAIIGLVLAGRFILNPAMRYFGQVGTRDVFVIATLLTVTGSAFLMESLHLSMGLGAFIAGVMLADSPYRHELEADIEPFRGLLLGLFFLAVGMALDLSILLSDPLRVVELVLAVVAVKTVVIAVLGRLFGSPWREAWPMGLLLSQAGEFGFVLLGAAVAALLITPAAAALFGAVVTLSMLVSVILMSLYRRLAGRRKTSAIDDLETPSADKQDHVIVIGYGRFGQIVTQLLHARGLEVTLIDTRPETIERSRQFGWKVYFGDGFRPDVLRAAGAESARMLIITSGGAWDPSRIEPVRHMFPNMEIVTRAHDREHHMRLVSAGIPNSVRELLMGAVQMGRLALERLGDDPRTTEAIAQEFLRRDGERLALQIASGDIMAGRETIFRPGHGWKPENPETALGEIPPADDELDRV